MTNRRYAPRCAGCRQKTMVIATVPYSIQIDHDGQKYNVFIPCFSVPKCTNCGAISIDEQAGRQISDAFHEETKLLTPDQISGYRKEMNLTQKDVAALMGISDTTLSRWETGSQVQQRAFDKYLRVFFASPWVRWYLGALQTGEVDGLPKELAQARMPAKNDVPSDYQRQSENASNYEAQPISKRSEAVLVL